MIRFQGLEKRFADVRVLTGISLEVSQGEIYGLIGPNGAGKTTTFRIAAGLLRPTAGTVQVAGVDVAAAPEQAKARLGFSTGSAGLYGRLTAREQLEYFGELHRMSAARLRQRIDEVAEALDLGRLLDRRCERLSTGEKQRVAIARAMLHDPPVLILDEPTSGLDVLAGRFLRDYVLRARDQGKAILFSSHYLAEAELLCDRVGFLHKGSLVREGRPLDLKTELEAATLEETFLKLIAGASSSPGPASP
ncbi:MAG: ABC transporter ATP-binding protein [Deltaproteobacteria bacterium]|nr:ABC transporter ATP-binding protein [Deltaproteobacteria bacterium]